MVEERNEPGVEGEESVVKGIIVTPGTKDSVRLQEMEPPDPAAGQLLLKVLKVGVCGTDRDIIAAEYGQPPPGSSYLVLGHESLCRVEELGKGVRGFEKNELVVPTVRRDCPQHCLNCRRGESDMCLTGNYTEHGIKGLHGFARGLATSDHRFVVKMPEALREVGVLLEPLTIDEKGVLQSFEVQHARMAWEPSKALVLGAGPVGLLATALLRLRGMEVSTVATRSEESLKARLVRSTGAEYLNANDNPVSSLTPDWDIVLEATGSTHIAVQAERLCGVNGVVCYVGIYRSDVESTNVGVSFTNLVLGNKVFLGSVNANKTYFEAGTRDLLKMRRRWPGFLESIITQRVPPERFSEAYDPEDEEEIKSVIEFG
jgi:glucose 1-dehydrogenase